METPRPQPPAWRRPLPLAGFAVMLVLGFLIAGLLVGGILGKEAVDRPSPPCPGGWLEHPRDGVCMEGREACRAWLRGSATETVSCAALSRDGRAFLDAKLDAMVRGTALVEVVDGDDRVVHSQRYDARTTSEGRLTGVTGSWTLRVTFESARGTADILLWG